MIEPQLPEEWATVEPDDDGVVSVDASGVIVGWDDAAHAIFGWSRHQAVGKGLSDVIAAPPEVIGALSDLGCSRPPHPGQPRHRRLRLAARHRDGHIVPVELTAWVASGDEPVVTALVRDFTAVLRAEEVRSRMAAIVTSSPDAILSEDVDGPITSWNVGAEQIFGWTAAEVLGGHAGMLVPADRVAEATHLIEQVRRGESVASHETQRLNKHGHPVDVGLTLSAIRDVTGRVAEVATIARDVTEQRWLASALDESVRHLQAAVEAATAAEERTRTFLADAAHQLRHPIAGVQACVEALLGDPSRPDRHRLLANMVRGTAHAGRLVTDLLRMARLDQGEHVITPTPCDVVGICTDEADRLYSLAPNLDIVLRAERLDDAHPAIDAEAVREILSNLLDNARRYATERISITVTVENGTVEIRVADDGPGLPDDLVERAFERFVTVGDHGGSGLGLPIARGLARASGGDLVHEGAFVLRLPVAASERAAPEP